MGSDTPLHRAGRASFYATSTGRAASCYPNILRCAPTHTVDWFGLAGKFAVIAPAQSAISPLLPRVLTPAIGRLAVELVGRASPSSSGGRASSGERLRARGRTCRAVTRFDGSRWWCRTTVRARSLLVRGLRLVLQLLFRKPSRATRPTCRAQGQPSDSILRPGLRALPPGGRAPGAARVRSILRVRRHAAAVFSRSCWWSIRPPSLGLVIFPCLLSGDGARTPRRSTGRIIAAPPLALRCRRSERTMRRSFRALRVAKLHGGRRATPPIDCAGPIVQRELGVVAAR